MTTRGKSFVGLVATLVAAITGFYFASPWIVMHSMRSAANEGNHRKISDHVDYPALRESIRGQVTQLLMASMDDPKLKDNPFAGLGVMLGMSMVGPMVDAMVTPQALAQAMTTGALKPVRKAEPAREPTSEEKTRYDAVVKQYYDGLDRFIVAYSDPNEPEMTLQVILKRNGAFDWKVTDIELPIDAMKRQMNR